MRNIIYNYNTAKQTAVSIAGAPNSGTTPVMKINGVYPDAYGAITIDATELTIGEEQVSLGQKFAEYDSTIEQIQLDVETLTGTIGSPLLYVISPTPIEQN